MYQCVVCDVGRESVTLQISKDTSIAWYDDNVTIAHSIELHNLVYTFCSNKINTLFNEEYVCNFFSI